MIGGTVAFDACEIAAGGIGVDHGEVDAEAGDADLRMQGPSLRRQTRGDRRLERAFVVPERGARRARESLGTADGIVEELLEMGNADRRGAGEVDVLGAEAAEHQQCLAGARDGDVQPPLATGLVEGAEVHRHASEFGDGALCILDQILVSLQDGALRQHREAVAEGARRCGALKPIDEALHGPFRLGRARFFRIGWTAEEGADLHHERVAGTFAHEAAE